MIEAAIKIVIYHTDGHAIWLAPWTVYAWLGFVLLWAIAIILSRS